MHGRVKSRTTEEQREIARLEKCKKAKAYQESMRIVIEKRSSLIYDQEALDLTAGLLTGNPDIVTLWNYRREIFLNNKNEENLEEYQKLLEKDLSLTEQCLKVNPKSYSSWHHRIWILENLPQPDWEKELKLCNKYLQLDERNFHCWDYRRLVTQKSKVPDESEYKYTLEKIETNFSNYSAWHLRSKLIPKIFPDPEGKFPFDQTKHNEELKLVENAAFTDPNDQSAWFYLRWLLGVIEPKVSFVGVERRGNEILVVTSRHLKLGDETSEFGVKVKVDVDGVWESDCVPSCVWRYKLKEPTSQPIQVKLVEKGVEYHSISVEPETIITNRPEFYPTLSGLKETLKDQLSSCQQLLELEPDSKWTLLTSILLMLLIGDDQYESDINEGLDTLAQVDPLRTGYYFDLKSKILTERAILNNFNKIETFALTNQRLTALYHCQYYYNFKEIDLSCNQLNSNSLSRLYPLVNCKVLILNRNVIESLNEFPVLEKLEILKVDENKIEKIDVNWVKKFPRLTLLSLENNPLSGKKDLVEELTGLLSCIKLGS